MTLIRRFCLAFAASMVATFSCAMLLGVIKLTLTTHNSTWFSTLVLHYGNTVALSYADILLLLISSLVFALVFWQSNKV